MSLLDRFQLARHGTTVRTELVAGLTTFLTLAYIVFVNPSILAEAGMDHGAVFVATCLAAAFGSLVMGLGANLPIALAPGMGLNAYFTYGLVLGAGVPWQTALGVVFVAGVVFLALSVTPLRERLIDAIPASLVRAIAAGIGFLLALLALQHAGIVADSPATLVTVGDLKAAPALLAGAGFVLIAALDSRGVPGAILIGILAVTAASILLGESQLAGVTAAPPSLAPTFLAMDLAGALDVALIGATVAFLFVDLFDTAGTLVGVTHGTPLLDARGRIPRLGRALLADSSATVVGACLGTSTVTAYIESSSGIRAGGRTGLTAVVVALLLIACIFLAPLAQSVPAYATAPALLYVAVMMARALATIAWDDATEAAPVVVTALGIPLTFSIATGIGLGVICYAAIKLMAGRFREVSPGVLVLAALFIAKFWLL